jgi:hypothetical protein
VLLGLAYETAVEKILMELVGKALVDPQKVRRADAGERLGTLKSQLSGLKFQQDERRLAEAAVDFADHLRERRNDAAHTTRGGRSIHLMRSRSPAVSWTLPPAPVGHRES